ncbi:MAG: Crp/Fnr family transcriptional regulator [Alphaproteobacteria bacterium]|jgi:CRP-like cAMP-binding protein
MSDFVDVLFSGAECVAYTKGKGPFRTGDPVRFMHRVIAGQVDLIRYAPDGARMILQRAVAGQVLAEASAYSHAYHCDAIATAASRVEILPLSAFLARLDEDSVLARAWTARLAHALQGARTNAEIRTLRTVARRLDAWLDGGNTLPPKGHWQDLAQILGVTREALYRELATRDELIAGVNNR